MKLQQDAQFVPTQENVSLLLAVYGLELVGYKLADSGIENCTIMVQTKTGAYVLRVYRQGKKSDGEIQRELDFVEYLGNNGIPVAPPIANLEGQFISHLDQNGQTWQAILMQHLPGSHAEHYSKELLVNLAVVQACMHNLAASYAASDTSHQRLTELRETHFIGLIQNRETLDSRRRDFIDRAERYVITLDNTLSQGLCHLDFDAGNVLCENDIVTAVLDFDDLTLAPYVMCLAYTLWDVAYDLGLDGIAPYIETYEKSRPLTKQEKNFLKPIMLSRHYMIGCKDIADNQMDESTLVRYLELERALSSP